MQIIELNELQFKNYSNIHSKKNYKQSIEFSKLQELVGFKPLYLGLMDDSDNVIAATLLLEKKLNSKLKYGYCPNGYLIDFFNINLVNIFTVEFKKYLKENNYIYTHLDPRLDYQILSNKYIPMENNSKVINDLKKLGYNFLNNTSVYEIVLNTNDINKTYNNFKRSLKRNINSSLEQGVTIHKCNDNEFDIFLNMLNDNKNYYKDMYDIFKNNNIVEVYYAKINPETYVNNYRYLLKKETDNNNILNKKLKNINIKKTNKLVNNKMISDKLLIKYNNEIKIATELYTKYPNGCIVSGCMIINNGKEIVFIKDVYDNNFSNFKTIPLLKWEIIKKYINNNITTFRLGNIPNLKNNNYKTIEGFNGNIIESNNSFDLIINEMLYKLNNSLNSIRRKNNK